MAEHIAPADLAAIERARALLHGTAERLAAAGARDEALARYEEPKPVLGVLQRRPTMRPLGRAWRLGALLLQADGAVWATGVSTRVAESGLVSLSVPESACGAGAAGRLRAAGGAVRGGGGGGERGGGGAGGGGGRGGAPRAPPSPVARSITPHPSRSAAPTAPRRSRAGSRWARP